MFDADDIENHPAGCPCETCPQAPAVHPDDCTCDGCDPAGAPCSVYGDHDGDFDAGDALDLAAAISALCDEPHDSGARW